MLLVLVAELTFSFWKNSYNDELEPTWLIPDMTFPFSSEKEGENAGPVPHVGIPPWSGTDFRSVRHGKLSEAIQSGTRTPWIAALRSR